MKSEDYRYEEEKEKLQNLQQELRIFEVLVLMEFLIIIVLL
jgi:hypothetical protein